LLAAEQGKRTLVCEVDAKGNLADFYEAGETGFAPRELQPNLWVMSMNTEDSLKEYLSLQLKIPLLGKLPELTTKCFFADRLSLFHPSSFANVARLIVRKLLSLLGL